MGLSLTRKRVEPQWLSLKQVTDYASVSERTVRNWIHSPVNPLPAVLVRGKFLVRREHFEAWLERHRVRALHSIDVGAIVQSVLRGSSTHER